MSDSIVKWTSQQQLNASDVFDVPISSLQFDKSGNYLASGDRSGHITIYKHSDDELSSFKTYHRFRSHKAEFDYLKSVEIEEAITQLQFLPQMGKKLPLLASNEKTIKLWSVYELSSRFAGSPPFVSITPEGNAVKSKLTNTFAHGHSYMINSLSLNSDQETFLSSDDLRINMWNLQRPDTAFLIVDIKPPCLDDLDEIITKSHFHPVHCNMLMWSTSRGDIKMGDLRERSLCDVSPKVYRDKGPMPKSFFGEILSYISDAKFSNDGEYILTRDFLSLKLWDIRVEHEPVKKVSIQDHLIPRLSELYEGDHLFDKFECAFTHDSSQFVSGSYCNMFTTFNKAGISATTNLNEQSDGSDSKGFFGFPWFRVKKQPVNLKNQPIDYTKKCQMLTCHPKKNIMATVSEKTIHILKEPTPTM